LAGGVPDETEPPRKQYAFKEREFQRDERPASESRPPVTVQGLTQLAGPVTRSGPVPTTSPKAGDPNDVFATLQKNRAAEMNSGGDEIEIKKISSRRKKDYWLMLVGGNVVIVGGSFFVGGIALVFGLAGVIIYSLGLTWVMWQVMSKY